MRDHCPAERMGPPSIHRSSPLPESTMRKLKLEIEALEVTSFETRDGDGERGTVAGHGNLPLDTNRTCGDWMDSCNANRNTCWGSCYQNQCGPTPNGACGGTTSCPIEW